MKVLHFDCFAGISGDMALGAFVDLGVAPEELNAELAKLKIAGWRLRFVREDRNGIMGTKAVVEVEKARERTGCEHAHEAHEHNEHEHHHEHEHAHNSWREIRALIEGAGISATAKARALDIFRRIAEAEAAVHGVPVDEVAFHEVGALDSIIDIVGAAVCLDLLKPERITCGEIELGGGVVQCAHGVLPVPAPATERLLRGLPVRTGGFDKEMTTPTGAAILASCVNEFVTGPAAFRPVKTGTGIGARKLDKPNILRVSWREAAPAAGNTAAAPWLSEELLVMEANIDDMTGEALGFLMERFFAAGALDVTFANCVMKKSRPGVIASVLCREEKADAIRETFFRHSTAAGFRETRVNRLSLRREEKTLGGAREKTVFLGAERLRSKIEFDDRAALAREKNITLEEAEALIRGNR